MSFDLSLSKGDLSIGEAGEFRIVRDTTKAVQDILKILHEPVGSNPLSPNLGADILLLNIGQGLNPEFAATRVEASVRKAIEQLQQIQARQVQFQEVTPAERIVEIAEVTATANPQEPRQFDIQISIITGELTTVALQPFTINSTVLGQS